MSVGKPHEAPLKAAIDDFSRRLSHYCECEWKIISPIKNAAALSANVLKKKEAEQILQQLAPSDVLILLDERGSMLSSDGLADYVTAKQNASVKKLHFLIGGAFGVDESIRVRANYCWSLSKLVFPHMLVRLILAEQLYRAFTIIHNEKYHHT